MARDRPVGSALEAWRDAERRLRDLTPGTTEYVEAALAYDRARVAYRSALANGSDVTGDAAQVRAETRNDERAPEP